MSSKSRTPASALNKAYLVGYEFSREGGVEEVSRQILAILQKRHVVSSVFKMKATRFRIIMNWLQIWIASILRPDRPFIFLHPYLFEKSLIIPRNSIVWVYGIDVWGSYGFQRTKKLCLAKKVVSISTFTTQQVKKTHGNIAIRTVGLAVDNPKIVSKMDRKGTFELLTVARLSSSERYKGHDLTIESLALLKEQGIKIRYNIVGRGDDQSRLKRLSEDLRVRDQVIFHGYVDDQAIVQVYRRSSIFVMPSYVVRRENKIWGGEGFGLVYLEAGLHGLPVIACDEGGQTDCIADGKTGFLVKPDPRQIAEKIRYLYENPKICSEMGERGRKHVQQNFSFMKFEREVIAVVEESL